MEKYLLSFFLLATSLVCFGDETCISYTAIDNCLLQGCKIDVHSNAVTIASISYVKLPIFSWYIVFDFFVESEFRNRGIGKTLLSYVVQEIIDLGGKRIYVQPGPYERVGGIFVPSEGQEREERMKKLVKFYSDSDFKPAMYKKAVYLLCIFYKILGINENPDFLLVRMV